MESLEYNFLKDSPEIEDLKSIEFYHKEFAPALKNIIESNRCLHTFGLFGKWGSGKSLIIKLLKRDLDKNSLMIEFDCWKYKDDSLRRQLILKLAKDIGINSRVFADIEKKLYTSASYPDEETFKFSKNGIKKFFIKFGISFIFISLICFFTSGLQFNDFLKIAFTQASYLVALILFAENFILSEFKEIIRVSNIIRTKGKLDSPELFEATFKEIIRHKDNKFENIIIVIDNLDRVDSDSAKNTLSTIKTFLELRKSELNNKSITFIIPCDYEAIRNSMSNKNADEYLRKIFNVIIWTPEFYITDLEEYTKNLLNETGEIKEIINTEDVRLVIQHAFSTNPREIKQFINNLISSIITSYNSKVWDIIKGNISYLAKILILKQKFPEAYLKLKEKWYEPEEISDVYIKTEETEIKAEFEKFMINTSRISAKNAEPFIYFKHPVVYENLKKSEILLNNLLHDNFDESNRIFNKYNQSEIEKNFVPFILDLFEHYKNQTEILWNIFKIQLKIMSKKKIHVESRRYYNESLSLFDKNLWQYYIKLSPTIIFNFYITNEKIYKTTQNKIIERYVQALESEELQKAENISYVYELMKNFVSNNHFLNKDHKIRIASIIEKHYAENFQMIKIFNTLELQKLFLTSPSLESFISTIKLNEINTTMPLLLQMKEHILEKKPTNALVNSINNLLDEVKANPDYSEEKKTLMLYLYKIFDTFILNEEFVIEVPLINGIINRLVTTFDGINSWDKRYITLINIIKLKEIADDSQIPIIEQKTNNFFQNSSSKGFNDLFNFLHKNESDEMIFGLIKNNFDFLKPRMNTDGKNELLKVIYNAGNEDIKIELLEHIIRSRAKYGLEFIKNLEIIPTKTRVFTALLNRTKNIANPNERIDIYTYINGKLNLRSNPQIKDLCIKQMLTLLKTDDSKIAEVGYNFFRESTFIGKALKREMLKELLSFLRAPGKNVTSENRYAILALAINFDILQSTTQTDFVYFLFDLLNQKYDLPTIQVALEYIEIVNPKFSDYKTDFDGLKERLKVWPEDNKRNLIINGILKYKPKRPGKVEKKFWSDIELIKKQLEDSE